VRKTGGARSTLNITVGSRKSHDFITKPHS